jgi:hypothetical protein
MTYDPFSNTDFLRGLPDATLRDLGRNDAAKHEFRKLAVEILLARKSPLAKHEELRQFVRELNIELEGIEWDHPAPGNPLVASVTTETMFGQPVDDNQPSFTGFDEVEISEPIQISPEEGQRMLELSLPKIKTTPREKKKVPDAPE